MAELSPDDSESSALAQGIPPWLDRLSVWWALGGGLIFCAIVVMSIVSIVGRKLFSAPLQGDVELLQIGAAVASAAFLPICELYDHHIKVDALTTWMTDRGRGWLDTVAHLLLVLMGGVLAWRTWVYALETHETREVSTLLLVPLWIPVALMVPSFVLLVLTALMRAKISLGRALKGGA